MRDLEAIAKTGFTDSMPSRKEARVIMRHVVACVRSANLFQGERNDGVIKSTAESLKASARNLSRIVHSSGLPSQHFASLGLTKHLPDGTIEQMQNLARGEDSPEAELYSKAVNLGKGDVSLKRAEKEFERFYMTLAANWCARDTEEVSDFKQQLADLSDYSEDYLRHKIRNLFSMSIRDLFESAKQEQTGGMQG